MKQYFTYDDDCGLSEVAAETVEPRASALIESLRAFGYTTKTAIADLIDNSISARATTVRVEFRWSGADSSIAIADDGCGMTTEQLVEGMRLGTSGPAVTRDTGDLGRFGLGLKTASFSQCRRLTVASKTCSADSTVRCWDLDYVVKCNKWQLLGAAAASTEAILSTIPQANHGTVVVWENLDRILLATGRDEKRGYERFLLLAQQVKEHLAMVFHRFIEGKKLSIVVNGMTLPAWDPYLISYMPATQHLCSEPLDCAGSPGQSIVVNSYVLPHESRLPPDVHRAAAGPAGWNAQQGFYVYRGERLLVPGDWLGIGSSGGESYRKEEHFKLARIMVDVPTTADENWDIDVRKSTARPPAELRESLRRIAEQTRLQAAQVYRHRGAIVVRNVSPKDCVWTERILGGKSHFTVNRDHPLVRALQEESPRVKHLANALLQLLDETFPAERVLLRISEQQGVQETGQGRMAQADLAALCQTLHDVLVDTSGLTNDEAWTRVGSMEPFNSMPGFVEKISKKKEGSAK